MRRFIRKPRDLSARKFVARLFEINEYLHMFPPFQPNQQLPLDELLDIAEFAVPATWQRTMRMHGFIPIMHDENVFVEFCERCEFNEGPVEDSRFDSEVQRRTNVRPPTGNNVERDARQNGRNRPNDRNVSNKWCEYHQSNSHDTGECCTMLEQAKKMWAQFVTNKVTHQNLFKKKQVTFQMNKPPQSEQHRIEAIVNSYLDKQHASTNETTEMSDNFMDLHINENDDNQPPSDSDSE